MDKIKKIIVSMLVIAMLAFSSAALITTVKASALPDYNALPWANGSLVTPGTLTIYGSSTVGPIATEETGTGNFVSYFNSLVTSGTITSSQLTNPVVLHTDGSGTAIPALDQAVGSADVGEMSRPPSDAEWTTQAMSDMQLYAVGVDSVAIVLSPDMSWFPTNLTTEQVASLFADTTSNSVGYNGDNNANGQSPINSPTTTWADSNTNGTQANQGTQGNTGTTATFKTWGQFLDANKISETGMTSAELNETINRAVRDPTSGTFDCFNNYFAVPNNYQFEYKAPPAGQPQLTSTPTTVQGSQEMAPFTYCEQNIDVYDTVHSGTSYIGFISLGYLQSYGGMIGLNIAYNYASAPSSLIAYKGSKGTQDQSPNDWTPPSTDVTANGSPAPEYAVPTEANVIWAYSGIAGAQATGLYQAWRWLWEVVPGPIPSTGPLLAAGVWISYMMADGTTKVVSGNTVSAVTISSTNGPSGVGSGTSDFAVDQNYIPLDRDDMAGGAVLDSNLAAIGTGSSTALNATQTQSFPTGVVNFNDITYFVGAYINYNVNHVYNPYADMDANGVINFNDISQFVGNYIAYYTSYNPP